MTEWRRTTNGWRCKPGERALLQEGDGALYSACVLGLRDYVNKNGFSGVVLGLSGGIDSALVAAMSVDALGADRVHCIMLPYRYTSEESITDAAACAKALGLRYDTVPIGGPVTAFMDALGDLFEGTNEGVTEENIQSRTRGVILMAVSNKFGYMVVTTGNKSEMSVGYATLYGDMAGGFAVLKDVPKLLVYELVADRVERSDRELIPRTVIDRPPSAELRPDQKDTDSLPPYEILDPALALYIEGDGSREDLIESGLTRADALRVAGLVDRAEYKRRQAPPGVKITTKAFGRDRRLPITNGFRG
jgi:NAD+ synthase